MSLKFKEVERGREFLMTTENFSAIKKIAYELTGISLSDHKQNMIYGRLAKRLRKLGLGKFDEYVALLKQKNSPETLEFINAITTNLTAFFRENHHFEYLHDTLLPSLIKKNASTRKLRIWSAGCSSGEEPHSIAMVVRSMNALSNWDVKILATDLDSNVVTKGRNGVYSRERIETIPDKYQRYVKYNSSGTDAVMKDSVRDLIRFRTLNLLHDWPMKGQFDIIFCRNVVIYFDAPTQTKLFDKYANILQREGHLFIGHSENLYKVCDRFKSLGKTIYQRIL